MTDSRRQREVISDKSRTAAKKRAAAALVLAAAGSGLAVAIVIVASATTHTRQSVGGDAVGKAPASSAQRTSVTPPARRAAYGLFGDLRPIAAYLGMTSESVAVALSSGTSLADLVATQGRTIEGMIQLLVDAWTKQLEVAVDSGRLTEKQERVALATLRNGAAKFSFRHPRHRSVADFAVATRS
jgi:hypothetical protein